MTKCSPLLLFIFINSIKNCDYQFQSIKLTNQSKNIEYYRVISINRLAFRWSIRNAPYMATVCIFEAFILLPGNLLMSLFWFYPKTFFLEIFSFSSLSKSEFSRVSWSMTARTWHSEIFPWDDNQTITIPFELYLITACL